MEEYLTVEQAAAILGVGGSSLRRRLKAKVMRGEHVHRRLWLIPRAEVEAWQGRGRLRPGPKRRQREEGKG